MTYKLSFLLAMVFQFHTFPCVMFLFGNKEATDAEKFENV